MLFQVKLKKPMYKYDPVFTVYSVFRRDGISAGEHTQFYIYDDKEESFKWVYAKEYKLSSNNI